MSRPSDIPSDIWLDADYEVCGTRDPTPLELAVIEMIARAVMTERNRCAEIADTFEEDAPGRLERADDPSGAAASWASSRICEEILKGTK